MSSTHSTRSGRKASLLSAKPDYQISMCGIRVEWCSSMYASNMTALLWTRRLLRKKTDFISYAPSIFSQLFLENVFPFLCRWLYCLVASNLFLYTSAHTCDTWVNLQLVVHNLCHQDSRLRQAGIDSIFKGEHPFTTIYYLDW